MLEKQASTKTCCCLDVCQGSGLCVGKGKVHEDQGKRQNVLEAKINK